MNNVGLHLVGPDPIAAAQREANFPLEELLKLDLNDPAALDRITKSLQLYKPRFPPLERLPCANADMTQYKKGYTCSSMASIHTLGVLSDMCVLFVTVVYLYTR